MEENNSIEIIELEPGTPLCNGKYVIEKKIGVGGFGIAYKALQCGLNRAVCIKEYFISGNCIRDTRKRTVHCLGMDESRFEKYRQLFVTEARTLATLKNPNIVEVIDVFDENGTSYMVMPFIEGETLQHLVNRRGKLSYPETINYIAQITSAVGYIHERHILHRDIKPDNIMITSDYKAILIDFGSAREFINDKTQGLTSMVTQGYAPPEQYTYNSRKGAYTDIYAIGATLYFALTGVVPIEATARLTEKLSEPRKLCKDIPSEANRTIMKAMQLKAGNRHQSIQEFMDDLRNIHPSKPIREISKNGIWWGISISGIAIALLLVTLFLRPKNGKVKTVDFTKNLYSYPMIKVKGGTFTMGDYKQNAEDGDCPPHTVTLDDFYIGQFEVSQGFWKTIMGYNPSSNIGKDDQRNRLTKEQMGNFPVENISFNEVLIFIKRLNSKTGKHFSLPTEAQWEYAARGGNKSVPNVRYATQEPFHPKNVWYDHEGHLQVNDKYSGAINELGIYHMSGNVSEWCLDYYDKKYYDKSKWSRNPYNSIISSEHVIRGGSYTDSDAEYVNIFYRYYDDSNSKSGDTGFRLVININ